jgi:hypothetical protein
MTDKNEEAFFTSTPTLMEISMDDDDNDDNCRTPKFLNSKNATTLSKK